MKKILYFLAFAVLILSCEKDESIPTRGNFTLTGFVNTETKTQFGNPDNDSKTIPFLWSQNDAIWCGAEKSTSVTVSDDCISAVFNLTTEPTEGCLVYYNMKGSEATEVVVPSQQDINNSLGENGDFGYATVTNGAFTLTHATSYLWFDVSSSIEGAMLVSIDFDVPSEFSIAGISTWDNVNSTFSNITNRSNTIRLAVNQTLAAVNENLWPMVIYPTNLSSSTEKIKITYKLKIGEDYKYCTQTLSGKNIFSGNTYKISKEILNDELYEMRVLTFEDSDIKFEDYYLDCKGEYITKWSDLIDELQHGGSLLYDNTYMSGVDYFWYDENNTELYHEFPENWGIKNFPGGGIAISKYANVSIADVKNIIEENPDGGSIVPYTAYQLSIPLNGGNSGSNFCIGYVASEVNKDDPYNYIDLPTLTFEDGENRIIDHLYVTNTSIGLYAMTYGYFTCHELKADDYIKLIAVGFDESGNQLEGSIAELYLGKGTTYKVDTWVKWDLSVLGEVASVKFYIEESQISNYWGVDYYNSPLYFAIDDIAVRF